MVSALCTGLNSIRKPNAAESFVIAETVDLDRNETYAKERALIEEVKAQLARGRKCQVFAVYTNKHDVIERLEQLFSDGGHSGCDHCGPAFQLTGGKPGTASSCAVESMSRSAIPRSSKPGWICWTFRPSCFMRLATRCTRYASPAVDHGGSDRDAPWR